MASPLLLTFLFYCCFLQIGFFVRGQFSTTKSTTTTEAVPGMPTNLNYVAQTTSVNITWDSPQNYIYNVTYQTSAGDPKVIVACQSISVKYCNIGALSPGTSYSVTVTSKLSVNAQRTSSSSITVITKLFLESCKVQITSESSMNLSWSRANSTLPVIYYYQIVNQSQTFASTSLSVSIQGLATGTKYYFSVWANSGSSNSEAVTCGGSTRPFFEPCNVQTTSEISMNLSWSTAKSTLPVTYFYQIVNQSIFSTSSLSTSIQRLTPGTTYYFNVWANSASSNSETVTCGGSTNPFLESCNVQTTSESSMNLSWPKANSTLPVIYYYHNVNKMDTFSSGSLSASIQGLTPGTKYYFNVWANFGSSNSKAVTCGESTSPVKPLLLNVSQVGSTSLVANWNPGLTANGNFTAVYVCGNNPEQVKGLSLSDNPVILDNVAPGCKCSVTIKVLSYDKMNASDSSSIVTNPAINSPSCMISGVTNNSLTLSWTSASACLPFTYYYTYSTSSDTTASYSTTSNQAIVTGLSSGTVYTFRVYAKLNDTNNQSNNINCTSSTTFPISMEPLFGPVAGGTSITITGSATGDHPPSNNGSYVLDIRDAIKVYLGNDLSATSVFKVNASSAPELVAVTPRTTEASIGQPLPIIIEFLPTLFNMAPFNMTFNKAFTYLPNPEITSLYPNSFIVNGGILLDVTGQSLSSVAKPIVQLTVVVTRTAENSSTSNTSTTMTSRICTVPPGNATYMQCPMPPLNLPDDFMEIINSKYNTNVTRRRRNIMQINTIYTFAADNHGLLSRTKRYVNALTLTGPNGMDQADIYLGFILDGYQEYENLNDALTDTQLLFYPPPEINSLPDLIEFDPSVDELIHIKGRYMLRGCLLRDYAVYIGNQICTISNLQGIQMSCRPPKVEPSPAVNDTINCNQHLSITITVGYKQYQYACLTYTDHSRRLALIIGLSVGLDVFAIFLLIVLIVCIVRCRRKKASQETDIYQNSGEQEHQPSREVELRNRHDTNAEQPNLYQDLNIIHTGQKTMTLYKPEDEYENVLEFEPQEDYENVRRFSQI